jgi:hypothetical protein
MQENDLATSCQFPAKSVMFPLHAQVHRRNSVPAILVKRGRCNSQRMPKPMTSRRRRSLPSSGRLPLRTIYEYHQLDFTSPAPARPSISKKAPGATSMPMSCQKVGLSLEPMESTSRSRAHSPRSTAIHFPLVSANEISMPATNQVDATLMTETLTRSLLVEPTRPVRRYSNENRTCEETHLS